MDSPFSITTNKGVVVTFPYKINFTADEINLLKTLDAITLQKLVETARQLQQRNLEVAKQNSNQYSTTTNSNFSNQNILYPTPYFPPVGQPTVTSNTQSSQTPYYNSQTGQYQNTPANNFTTNSTGNPFLDSSSGQSNFGSSLNQYLSPRTSQPDALSPPSPIDFSKYDKDLDVKDISELCKQNYGMISRSGSGCSDIEGATTHLKNTAMKACTAVGKKLIANSVHRSTTCNVKVKGAARSSHTLGMAIDLGYGNLSVEERVKVFRIFKINGFGNLGCYSTSLSKQYIHLDHRPTQYRWGDSYSRDTWNPKNCPQEVFVAGY